MGLQYFYHPGDQLKGTLFLSSEESFHCVRVCRLRPGDEIGLLNGMGLRARARITNTGNAVEVRILEETLESFPSPPPRRLFISPLQAPDRMEWLTEKATELGVTEIHWIVCQRTEKKHIRPERLNRIAVAAMKQSGRPFLPGIFEPQPLSRISWPSGQTYWAACEGERLSLRQVISDSFASTAINIFIGPEGDFTPEETTRAMSQGAQPIHLGPWRLRSETAALVALILLASEI